ncbi:MAG: MFS transporter [Gemmataceae bacterium]
MANSSHQSFANKLLPIIWPTTAPDIGEQTRRRVVLHLIPFLFFLYILAYLDRVNVSVAKLGMNEQVYSGGLGFNDKIVGFGFGIFFWGYWILEVPSTLSVLKWGARYVFVRILVLWGLSCVLIGFIGMPWMNSWLGWLPPIDKLPLPQWLLDILPHYKPGDPGMDPAHDPRTVSQFYFFRFMLGFFEGGFFPSVILYLSLWFRPQDRARAIATFMSAIPVSSALGSPLSGLLLNVDWLGMPGWRWVFIIQGLVPIVAGFLTLFFLPNRPRDAAWLPENEKSWLVNELHAEEAEKKGRHGPGAWIGQAWVVLLLTGFYFCMNVTSYGLSSFMPTIIKEQSGLSSTMASVVAGLPFVAALAGMLVNGWHSDKTQERIFHTAVPLACLSVGLFLASYCNDMGWVAVLIMIFGVGTFMYAHLPAFWPIPSAFLGAVAAAAAIGFINMIGNLGGFVGPVIFGGAAENKEFARGLRLLAPFPLISVAIILFVGYLRRDRLPTRPDVARKP